MAESWRAGGSPGAGVIAPERSAQPRTRVLHVGPDPGGGGGMASVIGGLLSSSLAERYRLEMLTTYRTADPVRRAGTFAWALLRLVAWCAGRGPRIVHVHATVRGSMYRKAICVVVARSMRRPILLHVHAGAAEIDIFWRRLGRARARLVRRGVGTADRVVSVSSASARALVDLFGLSDVSVVPNAAPPVLESPPTSESRESGPVTVLYLGGFANPVKGGDVLVKALASLAGAAPSMRVLLAGPGEPPQAAKALLEADRRITWLGWLDEAARAAALAESDVFVLPSISEGLPMALLEAMAHGLAVVATDMGGVPDVLADGVQGILVPPGDPESLAGAVAALIERPDRRSQLGHEARSRARELSDDRVGARLAAIYRELAPG